MDIQTAKTKDPITVEPISGDRFLQILTEVYGALFLSYDMESKILRYTPDLFASALGYSYEKLEVNFSSFLELVHVEDRESMMQAIAMLDQKQEPADLKIKLIHKEGYTVSYNLRFKKKPNSKCVLFLLLNEQSAYEETEEIEELKKTKAHVISELQRSNKELEEFAYIASHDLQEPLRKISTFSGRLVEKLNNELESEGKLYLERIMASAENMRSLIDNLLEFSRISRTKQPFTELNLNFVIHQVKSELELYIEETGAKIYADPLPVLEASVTQMKQLFCNLINNAIKFRKPGQAPEIKIISHELTIEEKKHFKLDSAKAYYNIRICDNGIGFEKEYAATIFKIFQRLHGKSEYPGSGIGLAICKKIVDHHNGIIFAENIEGIGACFTIILPKKQP